MVIVFQNWTKSNYTSDFFLDTHTHTQKKGKLVSECMYNKLIILNIMLVSCHHYFSCLTFSHCQDDSFTQQIPCLSFKYIWIKIYIYIYIYSKLASRASYLYFLGLKYTVRCWQVPSTSSRFLAQLHLAFVNFKNKYKDLCVWDINDIYGLACNCILLNMQWTDP